MLTVYKWQLLFLNKLLYRHRFIFIVSDLNTFCILCPSMLFKIWKSIKTIQLNCRLNFVRILNDNYNFNLYDVSIIRIFQSRNSSSYAAKQFKSDTSLEAVDQQSPNNSKKTVSGRRKLTSNYDDRHLLRMAVNDQNEAEKFLTVLSAFINKINLLFNFF